ncbi:MAG: tRNA 2-thiouridine(34) synthase MnmA [Candidatus Caenarcaniphilales bacterium]|nr:tRNA 2-thiouridine(34) synthase MnmA [Candidatus Caenarcaniphilales bacterium]
MTIFASIDLGTDNLLPPIQGSRIAIAMSGGVDSSVAAALLKGAGYEVFGLTGWLMEGSGKCCDGGMLDAARVCEILGIEHQSLDLRKFFQSRIVNPYLFSYQQGRTPVPCMPCNTEVKWGSLLEYSMTLGATHLASGHYARLLKKECRLCIGRASNLNKDQSYMLWGLTQDQLSRTVFPLANLGKDQIRELAKEFKLPNWDKGESQDLCFIPGKPREYLAERLGIRLGVIKHIATGEILGQHSGIHLFTVGQRKGIGLANLEAYYVVKLDALENVVYVGEKSYTCSRALIAEAENWQLKQEDSFEALVKTRYNEEAVPALVQSKTDQTFEVTFKTPEPNIAPGQAAVCYDLNNHHLIGGGWIKEAIP